MIILQNSHWLVIYLPHKSHHPWRDRWRGYVLSIDRTRSQKSVRSVHVLALDRTGKAICVRSTAKMPGKDTRSPNSVRSASVLALDRTV